VRLQHTVHSLYVPFKSLHAVCIFTCVMCLCMYTWFLLMLHMPRGARGQPLAYNENSHGFDIDTTTYK
jgi:hypothetical protein